MSITVRADVSPDPNWPEGLLSLMKDSFISNSRLAQASLDFGLDWYIITRPAAQRKWRPMYVEDYLQPPHTIDQNRNMSTKTLADVVEALVGVSYLDGGLPKALDCVALFLPKEDWQGINKAREALYEAAPADMALPPTMEPLEALIGYTFGRKSLLVEAMTHSSYRMPGTHACLERLEFFGDSILEYLVVRRLFAVSHPKPLLHWEMHLLRTALVNADFLGFRVMEWAVEVPSNEVLAEPVGEPVTVQPAPARFCLWSFMRYSSSELALAQRATGERHAALRESIAEAMESGDRYPWALLARLQLQKYYSDVFESLLGAVYVDSGSFEACDGILERAGILPYLERMLRDGVNVLHPKEEIGQLAGSEEVTYLIDEKETVDDGGRGLSCQVLVGGKIVAQVEGGVSREEVRTRAAEEAVRYFGGLKKSYDGV
jgi:dsRNA-specific ribonuclease